MWKALCKRGNPWLRGLVVIAWLIAAQTLPAAETGKLDLTNARLTYGLWGAERSQNAYRPGDECYLSFNIEGITIDDSGKARYRMQLEIFNARGESVFLQKPQDSEVLASLGGSSLPAYAHLDVGLRAPRGEYSMKVTVTDRVTGKSASLTRKVALLPKGFAVVRPQLTLAGNVPTPPLAVAGQDVFLDFRVVGFERDRTSGQPNVSMTLTILDEKKQPVLKNPFHGEVKTGVPKEASDLPIHYLMKLNRPGKFTLQIEAKDHLSGKTSTIAFPVVVQKPVR